MVMTEPTGSFFPPRIFRVAVLISCKLPSSTRMMARQRPPAEDGKQAGQASNSSKISNHMQNSIILPVRDLLRRSKLFQESLPKLRLPLMFSILAMLSQDKVNLFNLVDEPTLVKQ